MRPSTFSIVAHDRQTGEVGVHRLYFVSGERVLTRLTVSVVREVQQILRGFGFYLGEVTGTYDEPTKEAFRRFVGVENFEERWRDDDQVDREVINYMRRRYGSGFRA